MERPLLAMMTVAAELAPGAVVQVVALVQVAGNLRAAMQKTQEPQVDRPTHRRSRKVQRSLRRGLLTHFVE